MLRTNLSFAQILSAEDPVDTAPVITSTPDPNFTEGIAATYGMSQHVIDDGSSPLTYELNSGIDARFAFNTSTGILSYDGTGTVSSSVNSLTVSNAVGADTSSVFNIDVNEAVVGSEADWQYRIAQPGVVFYHDFRSASEVDQFRENGALAYNPDNTVAAGSGYRSGHCNFISTDGVTGGGCLEIVRKAGSLDTENWYRPTAPLSSPGNGRTTDDPADGGQLALDPGGAFGPPTGTRDYRWYGNYGPASTEAEAAADNMQVTEWDGNQFYLHYAVKVQASREGGGGTQSFGGKVHYNTRMEISLTAQELIASYARQDDSGPGATIHNKWRVYNAFNNTMQSDTNFINTWSSESANTISWTFETWTHFLFHVVAGDENVTNSRIDVYRWHPGDSGYTKIFQRSDYSMDYQNAFTGGELQKAWNALILSGYFNSAPFDFDFYQRFDQVIFSKAWIPPPSAFATSPLRTSAESIPTPGQWTLDPITWNPASGTWDISWQNRSAFYDENRQEIQYMGKPQSSAGGLNRQVHFIYSEQNDDWVTTSTAVTDGASGHIWLIAFDQTEAPGDYYHVQQKPSQGTIDNTRTMLRYNRLTDTWAQLPEAAFDIWNNSHTPNGGMTYHPNLLGPGRPGIYCFGNEHYSYFDVVNQTWTRAVPDIFFGGSPYGQFRQGVTMYVPGLDLAMCTSGDRSEAQYAVFILGGDADNTTPALADLPVPVNNNNGNSGNPYQMLLDPTDPTQKTIMLLQSDGDNVYTTTNPMGGPGAWTLETWKHPFGDNNPYNNPDRPNHPQSWIPCAIPRYGVVMGLASFVSGGGAMLWRPGGTLSQV